MDEGTKARLTREQKEERAAEEHAAFTQKMHAAFQDYRNELTQRAAHLKETLFAMESPESANLLSRVALADKEELTKLLEVALETQNAELTRIAFGEAVRRNEPELIHRYLSFLPEENGEGYREWLELPQDLEESLARQEASLEAFIPEMDYNALNPPIRGY
jgi:hypothetical protein